MKSWKKLALLGTLYFSQGLPFGFFVQALPVLLRKRGVDLESIGLSSLLAFPWAAKFIWAPFVDAHVGSRLGPRRGFILPLQALAVVVLAALALVDPEELWLLAGAVFVTNLLAATQDIATDALAVDLLDERERGIGNGLQVAGYRVGMIVGGGALLGVYDDLGWAGTFASMAALLALATVPIALYREPRAKAPVEATTPWRSFAGWLRRPGALPWLVLISLYKAGDYFGTGMLKPFLVDSGMSTREIAHAVGYLGFAAGLVGSMLGGVLVSTLGRKRALMGFGLLQAASVGVYAWAGFDPPHWVLWALIGLEHLLGGMATAALFTAMMDACRPESAATDYTLQASVVVLSQLGPSAVSGFSAERLGYPAHFALAGAVSLVGVAYIAWYYSTYAGPQALAGVKS
jgi:PAT family beta-lactamase induction signal transducer AmpG